MGKLKVIKLTYGTHGTTKEYAYLVEKDVRVGQEVQPSVKHWKSGKIFGTTGVIQHVYGGNSPARQQAITDDEGNPRPLARVITANEAGVHPTRDASGRYKRTGVEKTQKNADGKYAVPDDKDFVATDYIQRVRDANVEHNEENPYETFAQYNERFTNKENENNESI